MKKLHKNLPLHRETLRMLAEVSAQRVAGGVITTTTTLADICTSVGMACSFGCTPEWSQRYVETCTEVVR